MDQFDLYDEPKRGMPLLLKCVLIAVLFMPLIILLAVHFGNDDDRKAKTPNRAQTLEPNADGMLTFHDRKGRYEIKYPASWTLNDKTAAKHMIRADISHGDDIGFQIRMYNNADVPFDQFFNRYTKQFATQMQGHWGGTITREDVQFGEVGQKYPSARCSFIAKRKNGQEWLLKQYLWSSGRQVIALQSGMPLNQRDKNEPQLDRIAETFRFLP